ncbi:MAG TPA: hypothetical protein VLI90_13525 [Tepidisphaeraceae bacterium]|nr:hypothetical protein [Tepidisphaeraceae bacterium]
MLVAVAIVASVNATARAQRWDFGIAVGYSHIDLDKPGSLFHSKDGPYFDADFAVRLPRLALPLSLGVGITGSGYFDSRTQDFLISSTTLATTTLYSDIGFFEIEPRATLAFYMHQRYRTGLFIKPRIGAGLLIDSYTIDHVTQNSFATIFETHYHSGAAFEVRPAVQVGYSWGPGEVGAEFSYMAAWGDLGDFGSEAQEFRAGPFFTWRF